MTQPLSYRLPGARWTLEFDRTALETIASRAQVTRASNESVGQLFSRDLTQERVVVGLATVLLPSWAAWARVRFDTAAAMSERQRLFDAGWHCLGLWHTHPEPIPRPSDEDERLAKEHAIAAIDQLNGLVFAIAGALPAQAGMRVWVHDGQVLHSAHCIQGDDSAGDGASPVLARARTRQHERPHRRLRGA